MGKNVERKGNTSKEIWLKRVLSIVCILTMSISLIGCTPSEDDIYEILDGIEEEHSLTMDATFEAEYMGIIAEGDGTLECDGKKTHSVFSINSSALGISEEEEYYSDGEYKYELINGSWEREPIGDSENLEGCFLSWDIDSISRSGGETIVTGTVKVDWDSIDDSLKSRDLDFKLRLDKKRNIESLTIKGDNISSELSSVRLKIYDVGETDVDLSEVHQQRYDD